MQARRRRRSEDGGTERVITKESPPHSTKSRRPADQPDRPYRYALPKRGASMTTCCTNRRRWMSFAVRGICRDIALKGTQQVEAILLRPKFHRPARAAPCRRLCTPHPCPSPSFPTIQLFFRLQLRHIKYNNQYSHAQDAVRQGGSRASSELLAAAEELPKHGRSLLCAAFAIYPRLWLGPKASAFGGWIHPSAPHPEVTPCHLRSHDIEDHMKVCKASGDERCEGV